MARSLQTIIWMTASRPLSPWILTADCCCSSASARLHADTHAPICAARLDSRARRRRRLADAPPAAIIFGVVDVDDQVELFTNTNRRLARNTEAAIEQLQMARSTSFVIQRDCRNGDGRFCRMSSADAPTQPPIRCRAPINIDAEQVLWQPRGLCNARRR